MRKAGITIFMKAIDFYTKRSQLLIYVQVTMGCRYERLGELLMHNHIIIFIKSPSDPNDKIVHYHCFSRARINLILTPNYSGVSVW